MNKHIVGLKDEFIGHGETQQPTTVFQAATFALIQEGVFERQRSWNNRPIFSNLIHLLSMTTSPNMGQANLWKAWQLKEYHRANGLCFKCGEKIAPNHRCTLHN